MNSKYCQSSESKESTVEIWGQSLVKSVLGFTASSGYFLKTQERRGKNRFDIVITQAEDQSKVEVVIEVKKLGANLDKADFRSGKTQLKEYLKTLGNVRWGILTNGFEWRLYDFENDFVTVSSIDIRNDDEEIDTTNKGVQESAWGLLEFSSLFLETGTWDSLSTEATALSPDSLAEAILSIEVVKKISKQLRDEHDFRVPIDTLTDKLSELIEEGLNDMILTWNETRRAELERYIRKQKRAAKKQKRQGKTAKAEATHSSENKEPATLGSPKEGNVIPFPISNTTKDDSGDDSGSSNVA